MSKQSIADTLAFQAITKGTIEEDTEIIDKEYIHHRFVLVSFHSELIYIHYISGKFADGHMYKL